MHPQELKRFDEYKEGWRKQAVKRKADASADKMRQTKLFCSPGSQLTQPKVDNLIVKYVVDGLHSLSTVEEPGFIQLVTGELSILCEIRLHYNCTLSLFLF